MALYDAGEMRIVDGLTPAAVPSRYGERRRPNWPLIAGILGFHVLLAAALDLTGALPARRAPSELKLIQLSPEAAPPPPVVEAKLPERVNEKQPAAQPQHQAAAPVFDAPPPIMSTAVASPVVVPPIQPAPAAPVQNGPVKVADLDAKAVTIVAPKYPVESRRKREQGTVVLAVTLGADGSVAEVAVARSSGFERLDKAALEAVRRWRWSPTVRDGVAVAVKGTVDIPFILQG